MFSFAEMRATIEKAFGTALEVALFFKLACIPGKQVGLSHSWQASWTFAAGVPVLRHHAKL